MRGIILLVVVGLVFLLGVRVGFALRGRGERGRNLASRKRGG